jgi:membrane protease YdiL (CAAX protease family)
MSSGAADIPETGKGPDAPEETGKEPGGSIAGGEEVLPAVPASGGAAAAGSSPGESGARARLATAVGETPPEVLWAVPVSPAPRWSTVLAWLVIAGLTACHLILPYFLRKEDEGAGRELSYLFLELQGRYLVGAATLLSPQERSQLLDQVGALRRGPLGARLRLAILIGELQGPAEAAAYVKEVQAALGKGAASDPEGDLLAVLQRLYQDYAAQRWQAPSVAPAERARLQQELGWFGDLALAPAKGASPQRQQLLAAAQRTFWTSIGVIALFLLALGAGLVLLLIWGILALCGAVGSALTTPSAHGGIYVETVALWLLFHTGASLLLAGLGLSETGYWLAETGVALAGLGVLIWPVLRGVPWSVVRREIGLTWGRGLVREPAAGLTCYLMAFPFLGMALFLFVLLQVLGGAEGGFAPPAHPVVRPLWHGGWGVRLVLLVLACVLAPVVEEIMFRGLLYRHLREATRPWGSVLSFLASTAASSLLFALLHPQGLLAVPLLMALAFGFCLAREWRGTLLPGMVAHALNNGLIFALALWLLPAA